MEAPRTLSLALALLLSLMLVSPPIMAVASSADSPFIVAHKKVTLTRLKTGAERVSVAIDLYNQGSATAYDVTLHDDNWPSDRFDIVSGKTTTSYEKLDAGSLVSHSFVLESQVKGSFNSAPAVIKFRVPSNSALQEAYSTPVPPLDILADRPPEKKFEWVKRLLAKYGSLVSVISIVVLFVYLVATPSKSTAAKASKKRR